MICLHCQRAHQYRPYFCVYPLIPVRLVFILVVFGLQLVVIWSSYRSSSRCPIKLPIKACATRPLGVQRSLPEPLFSSVPSGSRDLVCSQAEALTSSGRRSGSGRGPSESLTRVADSQTGRRRKVLLRKTAGQEASSFVLGGLSAFFLFPTLKFLKGRWLLSAGTPDGGNTPSCWTCRRLRTPARCSKPCTGTLGRYRDFTTDQREDDEGDFFVEVLDDASCQHAAALRLARRKPRQIRHDGRVTRYHAGHRRCRFGGQRGERC